MRLVKPLEAVNVTPVSAVRAITQLPEGLSVLTQKKPGPVLASGFSLFQLLRADQL
jgi:hypothetical protein